MLLDILIILSLFVFTYINCYTLYHIIQRYYFSTNKVVLYYLDDCYYSKKALDIWKQLVIKYYRESYDIVFVEDNKMKLKITHYPTIIMNDKHVFEGKLTFENVDAFIKEKID